MKKVLLFSISLITILVLSGSYVQAACPQGYTQRDITMVYYHPNNQDQCSATITYCYYCAMTGVGFDVFVDKIRMDGGCGLSPDFWTHVHSAIANDIVNLPGACIAPCSWGGWQQYDYTFTHLTCWKHVHHAGDPVDLYDIVPCSGEGATCNYVYKVCYDPGPPSIITLDGPVNVFLWGSIDCPYQVEQFDPPYWVVDPEVESWETECFTPQSACP